MPPPGPIDLLRAVDPRLVSGLVAEYRQRASGSGPPLPSGASIVLVGHRAAGKTHLLPRVAALTRRATFDLDRELERHHGRSLRDWVRNDEPGFRAAERARFTALPAASVVAVGGGFLSLHADLLEGHFPVLVPVSFETYRERLLKDTRRPRLRPELSLEDELAEVYRAREQAHAKVRTYSLVDLVLALESAPARGGD